MKRIKLLAIALIAFFCYTAKAQTISAFDSKGVTVQVDIQSIFYAIRNNNTGMTYLIFPDRTESYTTAQSLLAIQTLGCNKFYLFRVSKNNASFAVNDSVLMNIQYAKLQQTTAGKGILTTSQKNFTLQTIETHSTLVAQANTICALGGQTETSVIAAKPTAAALKLGDFVRVQNSTDTIDLQYVKTNYYEAKLIKRTATPSVYETSGSVTIDNTKAVWEKPINTGSGTGTEKEQYVNGKWLPTTNVTFATVTEMSAYTGNAETVIVTDSLRGGTFKLRTLTGNAVDNGIVFSSGITGYVWCRVDKNIVTPHMFGAIGNNSTDDTDAIRRWAKCGVKTKYIAPPSVAYKITDTVHFEKNCIVYGVGQSSKIDASTATTTSALFYFSQSGVVQTTTTTAATVYMKDRIKVASTSGFSVDDVIAIQNPADSSWSGWRPEYRQGEMLKIRKISNDTLFFYHALFDEYPITMQVWKIPQNEVNIKDFSLKMNKNIAGENLGMKFEYVTSGSINNVQVTDATYSTHTISRSYNIAVSDIRTSEQGAISGNNYGLVISSSQNINIIGGDYFGQRHGITLGGESFDLSYPARTIRISNAKIGSYGTGIVGADMHGSVDDVIYNDCLIYNGASISGRNTEYKNCTIWGDETYNNAITATEVRSGIIKLSNCIFKSRGFNPIGSVGFLNYGRNGGFASAFSRGKITIDIVNCIIDAQGINSIALIAVSNNGSTHNINFRINGLTLLNYASDRIVEIGNNSGNAQGDFFEITGVTGMTTSTFLTLVFSGAPYTTTPMKIQHQKGSVDIAVLSTDNTVIGGYNNFRTFFPKAPKVILSPSTIAGLYAIPYVYDVTSTQLRVTLKNHNSGTFGDARTFSVEYDAGIDDY